MKIHLLGPSCSGTSTLGKLIAESYNIPWFDSDDILWIETDPPYITKRQRNERIQLLENIFQKNDSLVLSGSAMGWGDFIRDHLNLVILKYLDQESRIKRLIAREIERFGNRIEPGNDRHETHIGFIEWCKKYETGGMEMRSRKSELKWISNVKCRVLKLENNEPLEMELNIVLEEIGNLTQ